MAIEGFSFPDFNIPEAKKDEQWHKEATLAIVKSTLSGTYDFNYRAITECMDFYNGTHTGDEFNFLQTAEDGDVLPAKWIPYNKIRVKIDLLLGEMNRKKYEVSVTAINKEATVRRKAKKNELYTKMRLKPIHQELEKMHGLPIQQGGYVPDNEEDLNDFMQFSYKEKSEIVMEAALKYLSRKYSWEYLRLALFRDVLIAGRCFVKNEIRQGLPYFRRIDPRNVLFDPNATDDFLSDATYVGEINYMGIAECAERYNLKKEQIQELYTKWKDSQNGQSSAFTNVNYARVIDGVKNVSLFRNDAGALRVLVYSAEWLDTEQIVYKKATDQYGGEQLKKEKDTYKAKSGEDVNRKTIKIIRKATLIGGDIMVEWGKAKNQVRDTDCLHETRLSYCCVIPNYLNGRGISKVEQMASLQKLKDITMYNMQLAMARAGSKGFVYDVSQCPDDWDVHTVLKYLKSVGVAFIDSKKDGIQSQFNQFQTIDMTLSASVEQYLNISRMIDAEMDAISGINEARQGIVQNSSQAVGVTQSALTQSNLSTETLFEFFSQFASKIFTYQAGLVKITFTDPDKFSPIIGETGVDFIKDDIQLDLDDYGVIVEVTPPIVEDRQQFQALVQAALQTGSIDFLDAIKLLQEKDLKIGIRIFEKTLRKKKEEEAQQQAMQAQQEQQGAMQQQQAAAQNQMAMQQQSAGNDALLNQQAAAHKERQQSQQNSHDMRSQMLDGRINQVLQQQKPQV